MGMYRLRLHDYKSFKVLSSQDHVRVLEFWLFAKTNLILNYGESSDYLLEETTWQ